MKSLFSKYIWLQLILSILLLFGGAIIIIFAINGKEENLADALNIVAAVIFFLFGAFAIIATFVFESKKYITNGLLYGSASIAMGVFLCLKKLILLDYLVYLLAIFFIVVGALELIKAVIITTRKDKLYAIILTYVVAAIFIAAGILALIFNDKVRIAFCIVAGALLFIAGVFELIFGVKTMIDLNKEKGGERKAKKKASKNEEPEEPEVKEQEPVVQEIDYTKAPEEIEQKKTDN